LDELPFETQDIQDSVAAGKGSPDNSTDKKVPAGV
jgi:hypothetical protein